ncbi:DUF2652 domain-containing protein [Flavitalea antarctica]
MKGLIFIPDISGFTNFVCHVRPTIGARITKGLLTEIIDNSLPDLKLAEVEGDALLFYKFGDPLPMNEILSSFRQMANAFRVKYHAFKLKYKVDASLSLKFILHFGEIDIYQIGNFEKLYGRTLVESHRLLKNGFVGSDYLLITEDYIEAANLVLRNQQTNEEDKPERITQHFTDLRDINYYFYNENHGDVALSPRAAIIPAC